MDVSPENFTGICKSPETVRIGQLKDMNCASMTFKISVKLLKDEKVPSLSISGILILRYDLSNRNAATPRVAPSPFL